MYFDRSKNLGFQAVIESRHESLYACLPTVSYCSAFLAVVISRLLPQIDLKLDLLLEKEFVTTGTISFLYELTPIEKKSVLVHLRQMQTLYTHKYSFHKKLGLRLATNYS